MSGTSGHTGKPLYLKCSTCKKMRDGRGRTRSGKLVRTGRERPYKPRGATGRTSKIAFECYCLMCEKTGWYAHRDAERLPIGEKFANGFERGFLRTLDSLRRLKRKAERHNDLSGPMPLWSGEILCLVDCSLAMLDRFDQARARAEMLENFRYGSTPD